MKNLIIKSFLAGIAISIGCIAYLITGYAWLFPIGLFIVCTYGLNLFTGKVCYATEEEIIIGKHNIISLINIWFYNALAANVLGVLMRYVRPDLISKARDIYLMKLNESALQIIVRGILCNIMIFVAVDTYRKAKRYLGLIFATTIFVACGFEHCIANAFYSGLGLQAGNWTEIGRSFVFLLINTVANTVGGIGSYLLLEDA